MLRILYIFLFLLFIPVEVFAKKPPGSAYKDGGQSKIAVILCHGRGKYPTWLVVNPLRKGLNKKLGIHTLSLQMPASRKNWRAYAQDFPQAYKTISEGVAFLKKKDVKHIYLMGHSMGSRMATAYLAKHKNAGIKGFIGVGIRGGGGDPLDSNANLQAIKMPVLDLYGDGDRKDLKHAQARSDRVSSRYKQVRVKGAGHKFTRSKYEKIMVQAVVDWLKNQEKIR